LFKKKEAVNINYLELIPFRVKESEENDGVVNIMIPKFKSKFFLNLIPAGKSKVFRVKLDELGSAVWSSIDGTKNVNTIVEELSGRFGEKIQPAEQRITKFLTQLFQSNFINFKQLKKEH
jgi:hypothetical protein